MGSTVVVVGGAGALGTAVVAAAGTDRSLDRVLSFDATGVVSPATPEGRVDALADASCLIYLGQSTVSAHGVDGTGTTPDVDDLRAWLAAAEEASVPRLVVLSSAMVYGAWPGNPVPLTESAPMRPDPADDFATSNAEVERIVAEWSDGLEEGSRPSVAVLRPTIVVGDDTADWFARAPWAGTAGQPQPLQVLHLDDLVSAVDHMRRSDASGAFNVAPDGWISPDELVALRGPVRRFTRRQPPSHYQSNPWVVANDRLRATGWEPSQTAQEAYVIADEGGPLSSLSAKGRQQVALAASVGLLALVAAVIAMVLRRSRGRAA